jgi:hypothetical protein
MAVAAALVITQGINVSAPGVTLEVPLVLTPVDFKNNDNTNVARWIYTLIDVPNGSALTPHVLLDSMVTTHVALTPDVPGTYRVSLEVLDGTGLITAFDYHDYVGLDTRGWAYPGFDDTNLTYNQPTTANPFGWKPPVNRILRDIHDKSFFLDQANGAAVGQTMVWNGAVWVPGTSGGLDVFSDGNNVSVTITDTTHNQMVGFRNLSAPRALNLPAAPSVGQRVSVANEDGTLSIANTVTVNAGANPIANAATTAYLLSNPYEAAVFEWTGTIWSLLSHVGAAEPAPGAVITGNIALGPDNTWNLVQANGETITQNSPTPGQLYEYTHVPGGIGSFGGPGEVTLAAGTGGFTIVDPQATLLAPAATATFRTDAVTYRFKLDSGANIFRCVN